LIALGLAACGRGAPAEAPPRHFVLITVDTLRADRVGAYGYARAGTPALDALARESLLFERAFSHASITFPSVASLLTGRLPAQHGVFGNGGSLPEGLPTLGTLFRAAGFRTAAFIGNYALRPSRRLDRGFEQYTHEYTSFEGVREEHPENRAALLTDQAIAWLAERRPEERLFLWVHYQEPHGPYEPPDFEPPLDGQGLELPESATNSGFRAIPRYQWLGHGRLAEYEARYDGEIRETDRQLARLLAALRARSVLEEGALLFTADHGEAFGEDEIYCAHAANLGDALLHVPLLLRLPGRAAERRADRVRLCDVVPTVAELFDLAAGELPGRSLLADLGDRHVVSQIGRDPSSRWRSLRIGAGELVEWDEHGQRKRGLAAEDLARAAQLLDALAPWPEDGADDVTEEERRLLKALGYGD
jgi:arylsulfatase A-like enzyme